MNQYEIDYKQGYDNANEEWLERIEKIRAEIKTNYDSIPWRTNEYDDGWVEALEWVLFDVIDKYKAESEVQNERYTLS